MPNKNEQSSFNDLRKITGSYPADFSPDVDQAWNQFRSRMHAKPRVLPLYRRPWLQVAAVTLLLFVSYVGFQVFTASAEVEWMTVTTPAGETQKIELADGSTVWLGEESVLRHPSAFSGTERPLELSGLAFFEVTPDPERPFRVQAGSGTIEVLGTSFQIRTYAGEATEEVLVREGRVAYEVPGQDRTELGVGDKFIYEIATQTARKEQDPQFGDLAWHTGVVQFDNTPLKQVLSTLERYFGVRIDRTEIPESLLDCTLSLRFRKHPELDEVLPAISLALSADLVQVDAETYTLQGGLCR